MHTRNEEVAAFAGGADAAASDFAKLAQTYQAGYALLLPAQLPRGPIDHIRNRARMRHRHKMAR
ncbi:hypothetical protein GCM10011400_00530 [Paraburkholderia caffeinilytica]|jgi:hypothetical protein|uniref:Uncharacterized protein n=1 Tax=Paraburkholderia caffeinilytica TaxID=1761016 RepID=A0ABQ1L1Z7_9BURK|nr:hypothetical protein GCM10011400_00530 [Paraburkholderia caffeinilytica]